MRAFLVSIKCNQDFIVYIVQQPKPWRGGDEDESAMGTVAREKYPTVRHGSTRSHMPTKESKNMAGLE